MRKSLDEQRADRQKFVVSLVANFGATGECNRNQIKALCKKEGISIPYWFLKDPHNKKCHGAYVVPASTEKIYVPDPTKVPASTPSSAICASRVKKTSVVSPIVSQPIATVQPEVVQTQAVKVEATQAIPKVEHVQLNNHLEALARGESFVPALDPLYVKFGYYQDLRQIVQSYRFYPVFISGLSGNGKTLMVEQVCAELKRDLFRVNITIETDEDDLLGGFRLIDGNTKWFDGPVVKAMKAGAVLLLDEVDLAREKILCLQPVLEGKGIFLKKINEFVRPARGFTVVATANTKGQGCESGKFIGTNILNEAFLERFPITFEQDYPSVSEESKILKKVLGTFNIVADKYVQLLTSWAEQIRRTYKEGGIFEIVSTRRLVHICNAYAIFGDEQKALQLCLNRFDEKTQESFKQLYEVFVEKDAREKE